MTTRINYTLALATLLVGITSVGTTQAGGKGFKGISGRIGNFQSGGQKLGSSVARSLNQQGSFGSNSFKAFKKNSLGNAVRNNGLSQNVFKNNVLKHNLVPQVGSFNGSIAGRLKNDILPQVGQTLHQNPGTQNLANLVKKQVLQNGFHNALQPQLGNSLHQAVLGNAKNNVFKHPLHGLILNPGIGHGHPPLGCFPPSYPYHCHPNWCWDGFNQPWVYGFGNFGGRYVTPTVINTTTVVEQPAPQPTMAIGATATTPATDLALKSITLVDAGNRAAGEGPAYRVVIENPSLASVDAPFSVTAIAARADRSFDEQTPRQDETVAALAAGKQATLEIRLPVAALTCETDPQGNAAPFSTLLVVIDGYGKVRESNRDNNAAALPRTDVAATLPTVSSIQASASAGSPELTVSGQSFGDAAGKLVLDLGSVRVPLEVISWNPQSIRVKLPVVEAAASVTTRLVVLRADGVMAEPYDLTTAVAAK